MRFEVFIPRDTLEVRLGVLTHYHSAWLIKAQFTPGALGAQGRLVSRTTVMRISLSTESIFARRRRLLKVLGRRRAALIHLVNFLVEIIDNLSHKLKPFLGNFVAVGRLGHTCIICGGTLP